MKSKKVSKKKIYQHFRAGLKQVELVSAKGQRGGLDGYHKFLKRKSILRKVSFWLAIISVIEFFISVHFRTQMIDSHQMNLFLWIFFSGLGAMVGAMFALMTSMNPNLALGGVRSVVEGIRLATETDSRWEAYEITGWPDIGSAPLEQMAIYFDRRIHEIDLEVLKIENGNVDALDKRARLKNARGSISTAQRVIDQTLEKLKPVQPIQINAHRVPTGLVKG